MVKNSFEKIALNRSSRYILSEKNNVYNDCLTQNNLSLSLSLTDRQTYTHTHVHTHTHERLLSLLLVAINKSDGMSHACRTHFIQNDKRRKVSFGNNREQLQRQKCVWVWACVCECMCGHVCVCVCVHVCVIKLYLGDALISRSHFTYMTLTSEDFVRLLLKI